MSDADSFTKFVPGFEFLQTLAKNAGSALPGIGQWVAPTLDPAELEKRISELLTVQFWLEQNARMIGTTIQALEVQRMTLSTLKTMNVQMDDLRESLTFKMPGAMPSTSAPAPTSAPTSAPAPAPAADATETSEADAAPSASPATAAVDPMQWWGALTQQFSQLAASALQEGGAAATKTFADRVLNPAAASPSPAPQAASRTKTAATRSSTASKRSATPAKRSTPTARRNAAK